MLPPLFEPCSNRVFPIYFGGASPAAIDVSARHADVFALWGRDPGAGAGVDGARPRCGGGAGAGHALQPVLPADPGRYGSGPPGRARSASWKPPSVSRARPGLDLRRALRPMRDRGGCWRPRRRGIAWTSACGPALRPPPARGGIPLPWSARRHRWRIRCSIIGGSASLPFSFAASTRSRMPSTMASGFCR